MTAEGNSQSEPAWLWPKWIARGSLSVLHGEDPQALTSMVLMLANSSGWGENVHNIPLQKPAEGELQIAIVVSNCDKSLARQALTRSLMGMSSSLLLVDTANFGLTTNAELKLDLGQMLESYALAGFFPTLLALDPWHQFLPSANLPPRQLMLKVVPPLISLAQRYDCALVFTQNTNDGQRLEAVRELADSVIQVERDNTTNIYTLVSESSRLSSVPDSVKFEFSP